MNITDEMVKAYWAAEARVWQTEAPITQGDAVVVNRAATRAGIEAVAPLIAAQALRSAAEEVERRCEPEIAGMDGGYVDGYRGASAAVVRLLLGQAGKPACCTRPNMVWEHSRGSKDHFRCAGCGGGMTKARATDV
jgi:hypothetical protein